ncbi:MAG: hypothetical protein C3F15_13360 [Holophagae bacterium]|nr:MAG: hypothetical protein C3F15_13360 [Holophagae bacterium]
MATPWTSSAVRWLPWAALATVVLSIAVGAWRHWTVSLPVVGAVRLVEWLLCGVYASVPLLLIGAVIVRWVDRDVFRLPFVLALATTAAAGSTGVLLVGIGLLAAGVYTPVAWQLTAVVAWLVGLAWLAIARWRPLLDLWTRFRQRQRPRTPLASASSLLILLAGITALHGSLPRSSATSSGRCCCSSCSVGAWPGSGTTARA